MAIEYNGEEMSKPEAVRRILAEHAIELNAGAATYAEQIANGGKLSLMDMDGLILYLASNIYMVDEDTRIAKQKLRAVSNGESPETIDKRTSQPDRLTELEMEDISSGFGSFAGQKARRDELLILDDFERFAEQTAFDLQQVLFAVNWHESALDQEVVERMEDAEEAVTLVADTSNE